MSTGHTTTLLLQGAALWARLQDMTYSNPERRKAFAEFEAWGWHNPGLREAAKRLQFQTFDKVNAADWTGDAPVSYVVVFGAGTDQERDETRGLDYATAAAVAGDRPRDHLARVRIAQDTGTGIAVRRTFDFSPPR